MAVVCLVAGMWALAVTLWGGGGAIHLGGLRISSNSPHNPLVIALVTGLLSWFLALTAGSDQRPPHRGIAFVAMLTLLVAGVNVLLRATPAPPPDAFTCYQDWQLRGTFRFSLNCDSIEFMKLAKDPAMVFVEPARQSRPLSFMIPSLIALPLRALPDFAIIPIGPPYQKEYLAYVVVNVATLVLALVCFTWALERGTGWRGGPEWLSVIVVLSANEITKMFLWNAHVQILNVLMPCLTIYLCMRLLERSSALTSGLAVAVGTAIGAGLLLYGSFVVPLLCVIAIQWFAYRRVWPGLLVGASAFLVYLAWVAVAFARTGAFYSHEVAEYRQFVWVIDCVRSGAAACQATVATNALSFFNATAPILAAPIGLAIALRLARVFWVRDETSAPPLRALLQASVLTWVVTFVLLALAGFYTPRLSWALVPPVLMLIAIDGGAVWRASETRRPWAVSVALAVICTGYVLMLAGRQGPYW